MGCTIGKPAAVSPANTTSRGMDIEKFLENEKFKELTHFKVLLLGAGESGKTTVIKQLKSIHKVTMGRGELNLNKAALHSNSLSSMEKFIEAAETFGYKFETPEEEEWVKAVTEFQLDKKNEFLTIEIANSIFNLWTKSETVKKTLFRRNEFWNLDASDYYFENVLRFVEDDFVPTEEDIIMARIRTTGIALTDFDQGPVHFTVVDVGGQRSERKKWIHCFDDVKAIVFVVSLAGYNQVLFEDEEKNRMEEALELFEETAANSLFATTPLFLFLNKKDLFEKMIRTTDLSTLFKDYTGGPDIKLALERVRSEFQRRIPQEQENRLHIFEIAARFKRDVKYTWEELSDILINDNKKDLKKAQEVTKENMANSLKKLKT